MDALMAGAGRGGVLTPDAHLAALAVENGGTIYSQDADFARFHRVRWIDPCA
jgi:predicted nucleic acid-binding protein